MNLSEVIAEYGTKAVLRYRTVAGLSEDNQIPEIFLGGFIVCRIYDSLNVNARVERLYTVIATEFGVTLNPDLINNIGGTRADIAVYQQQRPIAIVELKVFDDGKSSAAIIADRDKVRQLSSLCGVESYLGVLITDVASGATCTERARTLGTALGHEFESIGDEQLSGSGAWRWRFASGRLA